MTSIYDNTVCDVRQMSKHPHLRSSTGRVNSRLRTKTHPFYYTDWEEVLKREWNKRAPPLSPLEWKKKHAKNMNADDCCEFLMGRRCGRRRRLLFRSGYYLTIQPDGSVKGTKQKDSPYGRLSLHSSQVAHQAGAYPGFCYFYSPLDGLPHSIEFAGTHLYTWVERDTARVKCLAQEHNTMSPARARARTARSGVERTNHETTAPPTAIYEKSLSSRFANVRISSYISICNVWKRSEVH